jgi:hypothetical protein
MEPLSPGVVGGEAVSATEATFAGWLLQATNPRIKIPVSAKARRLMTI